MNIYVYICIYIYPFEDSEISLRNARGSARSWPLSGALPRSKLPRSRPLINFRRPRRHFERAFSLELAVLALELARPRFPGMPRTLIFEVETAVFSKFFHATRARRAKRPTSIKHWQERYETHFGASAQRPKIDQKSIKAGLE